MRDVGVGACAVPSTPPGSACGRATLPIKGRDEKSVRYRKEVNFGRISAPWGDMLSPKTNRSTKLKPSNIKG